MGRFDFKTRTGQISTIIQSGIIDADAQAFFYRVFLAGGTLTSIEQIAINELVLNMKSSNIWNSMKAIYPMVGTSAAACSQNLKSSSFTGTFTSGWTFASTGVTPNGTSAYMDTGLTPSTSLSQNSASLSYYSRTNNNLDAIEIGAFATSPTNQMQILMNFTSTMYDAVNNSPIGTLRTWNTDGFFVTSRTLSNSYKSFRNLTNIASYTTLSNGNVNRSIWVGGRNNDGVYTNRQCAFASIGDGLTDTQASNFYTAVQAFQTTLSRQV